MNAIANMARPDAIYYGPADIGSSLVSTLALGLAAVLALARFI